MMHPLVEFTNQLYCHDTGWALLVANKSNKGGADFQLSENGLIRAEKHLHPWVALYDQFLGRIVSVLGAHEVRKLSIHWNLRGPDHRDWGRYWWVPLHFTTGGNFAEVYNRLVDMNTIWK